MGGFVQSHHVWILRSEVSRRESGVHGTRASADKLAEQPSSLLSVVVGRGTVRASPWLALQCVYNAILRSGTRMSLVIETVLHQGARGSPGPQPNAAARKRCCCAAILSTRLFLLAILHIFVVAVDKDWTKNEVRKKRHEQEFVLRQDDLRR